MKNNNINIGGITYSAKAFDINYFAKQYVSTYGAGASDVGTVAANDAFMSMLNCGFDREQLLAAIAAVSKKMGR
mgnify:CR=1 FL=1